MQISGQEAQRLSCKAKLQARQREGDAPVASVADLAAQWGVRLEEARRHTETVLMADDPLRERRVHDLMERIASGTYAVEAEAILDMAERRALANLSDRL